VTKNQKHELDSKGIEEIERDVSNLVNEISQEKEKTENTIKNLVNEVGDSFEDAKKQTENKVSEINKKRFDLEGTVKTKLNSASQSLNKSIDKFKQDYDGLKADYRNSLMIPVAALIFVVFFYSSVISYAPWMDIKVKEISITQSSLVILALVSIFFSFQKLNKSFNSDTETLEKTRESIDITETSLEEVRISKQKFDDVEPYFRDAKQVLETFVLNLGRSTPLISQVFDELALLTKYGKMVESFELALNYYGLFENKKFFADLKKRAPADVRIIDDEHNWENIIIQRIIDELKTQKINTSHDIIYALYSEHNGFDTKNSFRSINDSDKELNNLAKILVVSKRLVQPPHSLVYRVQDIVSVLREVENFDLSEINNILSKSLRQLDILNSYVDFLDKNDINQDFRPDIEFIINERENDIDGFESQIVKLSCKIGKMAFSKIPSLDQDLIEGFTKASVSIKFHNDMSLKNFACEISSDERAANIIRAYYEKSKDFDRRDAVSLRELINDLNLVKSLYNKRDDIEFKFLISQLKEGKWYDSSAAYLRDFLETSKNEIKEQNSKIENFTILQQIVKDTFQKVKIGTVEKAIDAQVFGAYVIMFSSEKGNLKDIIDKLSKRDLDAQLPEKKWYYKSPFQIETIKKLYNVEPKYDFMSFSHNTRIGVIDKGELFHDFKNSFFRDLKTILSNTNKKYDMGLVVQRIIPSDYSFGIFNEQLASVDIKKNLDVADYIARLAVDHVPPEEQASVIKFEKEINLLDIVDMKSIYELIHIEGDDIYDREKKILESSDLKEAILENLDTNLKSLASDLRNGIRDKNEVTEIVKRVLESSFSSEPGLKRKAEMRADVLSKRFSKILGHLALYYESYRK
jgi:hypothetical protein